MAQIYSNVNEAVASASAPSVERIVKAKGREAQSILSSHRDEGHARIGVERIDEGPYPGLDWHIYLDDTQGLSAAMTIEKGRKANSEGKGRMRPVAPLARAVGLPVEGE